MPALAISQMQGPVRSLVAVICSEVELEVLNPNFAGFKVSKGSGVSKEGIEEGMGADLNQQVQLREAKARYMRVFAR